MPSLTAERLWSLLDYDDKSGAFSWRESRGGPAKIGAPVGSRTAEGYLKIMLDGKTHCAHRLAFLYMTGEWPKGDVDHIDGVKDNNAWANLRDVTRRVNAENRRHSSGAIGLLGVTRHHRPGLFRSRIRVDGRLVSLGCFDSPEKAHEAYLAAKRRLHEGCTI